MMLSLIANCRDFGLCLSLKAEGIKPPAPIAGLLLLFRQSIDFSLGFSGSRVKDDDLLYLRSPVSDLLSLCRFTLLE